jgi:hypothetical protein
MSFYNESTIAAQGQVNGKTLYLMMAPVLDTWVVDIVERAPTGAWTQMGWALEKPTAAAILEVGVSEWVDGLCQRVTTFLQSLFVNTAPPDPQTMEEIRLFVKSSVEFYDVGLRRK